MATKAKAKKSTAERADLAEKEPTQLHQDFADYITEQTGVEVDVKAVQLATILRMDFQRSEVNQARLQASKDAKAAAAAAREEKRAAKAKAKEDKASTAKTSKAPAKKAATKSAAKAPAKKAPARRRKAAAATEETF